MAATVAFDTGTAEALEEMMAILFLRPEQRKTFPVRRDRWWGCYDKGHSTINLELTKKTPKIFLF